MTIAYLISSRQLDLADQAAPWGHKELMKTQREMGIEGKNESCHCITMLPKTYWLLASCLSAARKYHWEKNQFHLTFQLNH